MEHALKVNHHHIRQASNIWSIGSIIIQMTAGKVNPLGVQGILGAMRHLHVGEGVLTSLSWHPLPPLP